MQRRQLPFRLPLAALVALAAATLATAAPVAAQGFLETLGRVAKDASFASIEMAMRHAAVTDLDARGLPTVPVGALTFGVAKVAVKDSLAVRLHAYLHNPGAEPVTVPVPDARLFALVDDRGRRMRLVLGPRVVGQASRAATIAVPALERVEVVLIFGPPAPDAEDAVLKVGALGMIAGIPLRGGGGTGGNVWTAPPVPPASHPPTPPTPPTPPDTGGVSRPAAPR